MKVTSLASAGNGTVRSGELEKMNRAGAAFVPPTINAFRLSGEKLAAVTPEIGNICVLPLLGFTISTTLKPVVFETRTELPLGATASTLP